MINSIKSFIKSVHNYFIRLVFRFTHKYYVKYYDHINGNSLSVYIPHENMMKLTVPYTEHMKTGWYNGDQYPVRVGVYEREREDISFKGTIYSWWDGVCWSVFEPTIEEAYNSRHIPSCFNNLKWRGLNQNMAQ